MIFKNCAPFTDCISELNNTQINNAKENDAVMLMYNIIEYNDNYLKTSGSLWKHYRDESSLNDVGVINNSPGNSASLKFKSKVTGEAGANATKNVKIWCHLNI